MKRNLEGIPCPGMEMFRAALLALPALAMGSIRRVALEDADLPNVPW